MSKAFAPFFDRSLASGRSLTWTTFAGVAGVGGVTLYMLFWGRLPKAPVALKQAVAVASDETIAQAEQNSSKAGLAGLTALNARNVNSDKADSAAVSNKQVVFSAEAKGGGEAAKLAPSKTGLTVDVSADSTDDNGPPSNASSIVSTKDAFSSSKVSQQFLALATSFKALPYGSDVTAYISQEGACYGIRQDNMLSVFPSIAKMINLVITYNAAGVKYGKLPATGSQGFAKIGSAVNVAKFWLTCMRHDISEFISHDSIITYKLEQLKEPTVITLTHLLPLIGSNGSELNFLASIKNLLKAIDPENENFILLNLPQDHLAAENKMAIILFAPDKATGKYLETHLSKKIFLDGQYKAAGIDALVSKILQCDEAGQFLLVEDDEIGAPGIALAEIDPPLEVSGEGAKAAMHEID